MLYVKKFLPAAAYSAVAGAVTAAFVFVFKLAANLIFSLSADIYSAVREAPWTLPILICGAALVGIAASFILKAEPDARGGGIPASIAIIRGLITFRWLRCIAATVSSVMLTFLCGVPLGTEGPSVQVGTAIGRGTSLLAGKRHAVLDRYIMTGGACAGFAAATGAPLCGILFAVEEAHRKLSPMIFLTSAVSVASGMLSFEVLDHLTGGDGAMFHFIVNVSLSVRSIRIAAVIGSVCGIFSVLFTVLHRRTGTLINKKLAKMPFRAKLALIFAVTAVFGFISGDFIGTGHMLIDSLISGGVGLPMLVVCLIIRAALFLVSNNTGVTGGAFIPSLALGALIGAICGKIMVFAGVMTGEYYVLAVTLGMAAYLGAVSKTPLMAVCFGLEALCGGENILAFVIASVTAYFIMEVTGTHEFADTVIENKVHAANAGKSEVAVEADITVAAGSFADGLEEHDILLPPGCEVSICHKASPHTAFGAGDVLHVSCKTYTPDDTAEKLREIFENS